MPNHFRQNFKVDDNDLSVFDKKIAEEFERSISEGGPKEYGPVEYLIAFNKEGVGLLFARERNDVEDGQGKDAEWQRYHDNLYAEARERGCTQNYVRVEAREDENVIWISCCDPFKIGVACPGYKVTCRRPK